MSKTEREYVESAGSRLKRLEALAELAVKDVEGVMRLNTDAAKHNAAFKAAAMLARALADFKLAHAGVTDILLAEWPGYDDAVVGTKGKGR